MPPKQRKSKRLAKKPDKAPPIRANSSSTEELADEQETAELLVSLKEDKSQASKKSRKSTASSKRRKERGVDPSRSNVNSLEPEIQEELLQVAESGLSVGGGRDEVRARREGVPKILNYLFQTGKEAVVGPPGTQHRKACDSKLRNWLKLSLEECEALCEHNQVVPVRVKKLVGSEDFAKPKGTKPPSVISSVSLLPGDYRDSTDLSVLTSDGEESLTKSLTRSSIRKGLTVSAMASTKAGTGWEKVGNLWVRKYYKLFLVPSSLARDRH